LNDFGVIVGFFAHIAQKLWVYYDNSILAKVIRKIAAGFNNLLSGSDIIKSFFAESRLNTAWTESVICRLVSWLFSLPIKIMGFIWDKIGRSVIESRTYKIVSSSLAGRLIAFSVDRFEILLGGSILIIASVNHKLWNNLYSTIFALALLFVFYIRALRNRYQGAGIKYLDFSFFAFVFVITAVQITGIFPKDSLKFFIFYLTCFLYVIVIIASMRTAKALNNMLEIMLMGISITGLYGLYQMVRGVPTDPSLVDITLNADMPGRVYSTMGNANSYAQVLILTLPFFAAVIFNAATIRRKLFFILAAMPPVVALLATGSRSGYVALALAGFLFVFFKERRLIPVFIVLGLLCIPIVKIVAPSVYLRALTIFNSNDTSIAFRDKIFITFKPMLNDYWITGIGLGTGDPNKTFMKLIQNYSLLLVNPNGNYVPPHTHVLYYQIWIETGIVGIVSFFWMILRLFRQSIIAIYRKMDEKATNIIISGISGLAGCLLIGTKEYIWFYPRTMVFFFVNIGIIYAAIAITKKKKETFAEN